MKILSKIFVRGTFLREIALKLPDSVQPSQTPNFGPCIDETGGTHIHNTRLKKNYVW